MATIQAASGTGTQGGLNLCKLYQVLIAAKAGDIRNVDSILGQEDPLEEGMAMQSRILAWRTPWTEEPDRLRSTGSQSRTRLKRLGPQAQFVSGFWLL